MLTFSEFERICARQRERLVRGTPERHRLHDSATVVIVLAGRLQQLIGEHLRTAGTTPELSRAQASLKEASGVTRWLQDRGRHASDDEMAARLLVANGHVCDAVRELRTYTRA